MRVGIYQYEIKKKYETYYYTGLILVKTEVKSELQEHTDKSQYSFYS